MIVEERIVSYINSLEKENSPVLEEIEKEENSKEHTHNGMYSLLECFIGIRHPK